MATATTNTPATTTSTTTSTQTSRQISQLQNALTLLSTTRIDASNTASSLQYRTKQLATLTSPASETSASLTQASANLASVLVLIRDATEKLEVVNDCEPSIDRLYSGANDMMNTTMTQLKNNKDATNDTNGAATNTFGVPNVDYNYLNYNNNLYPPKNHLDDDDNDDTGSYSATGTGTTSTYSNSNLLSEQDVYAAADSLEIIRDTYSYFQAKPNWKSSIPTLENLNRLHNKGVEGMCLLITHHLNNAGAAIRLKRIHSSIRDDASTIATNTSFFGNKYLQNNNRKHSNGIYINHSMENATETRMRLSDALQNRDLMKSVGEYEEFLPLDTRTVRELRAMYECLTGFNCFLNTDNNVNDILIQLQKYHKDAAKVTRTEKIGSGNYSKLSKEPLITSYPHLDVYSEARRNVAYQSMQEYYRTLRAQRKKEFDVKQGGSGESDSKEGQLESTIDGADMDAAARDAVRCLEHAMVIVAGEKVCCGNIMI